ncbi:MAG: hypothetical protein FVQ83_12870 [Chloroflexi bacterium]|nr:hypothetical protein [Chloroflexota bacterium]
MEEHEGGRVYEIQKDGNRRIYSLAAEGFVELRRYVENIWDDVLAAFQSAAEIQAKGELQ